MAAMPRRGCVVSRPICAYTRYDACPVPPSTSIPPQAPCPLPSHSVDTHTYPCLCRYPSIVGAAIYMLPLVLKLLFFTPLRLGGCARRLASDPGRSFGKRREDRALCVVWVWRMGVCAFESRPIASIRCRKAAGGSDGPSPKASWPDQCGMTTGWWPPPTGLLDQKPCRQEGRLRLPACRHWGRWLGSLA